MAQSHGRRPAAPTDAATTSGSRSGGDGTPARRVRGRPRIRLALLLLSALLLVGVGVAVAGPTGDFISSYGAAQRGLVAAGPVSPEDGFPDWYRDRNGIDLEGCKTNLDPLCGGAVPVPTPGDPTAFPGNFPDEFFYMLATADLQTGAGADVLAEFGVEGAFGSGPALAGDQMVFSRIRFRIESGLQADTDYKITHPYGTDVVRSGPDAADTPNIFVTQDVGAVVGDFTQALKGRVGPFLVWTDEDGNGASDAPPGYIGDPGTPHRVTGSDLSTNFVRIEGPGIGTRAGFACSNGDVTDCIETDLFSVMGKKSTRAGVTVARASYSRSVDATTQASTTRLDVFAESKPGQVIEVSDPAAEPTFQSVELDTDGGRYYGHVGVDGALPKEVKVVNTSDEPDTVKMVAVTDLVTAQVNYDRDARILHILAGSSDKQAPVPTLTFEGFEPTLDATDHYHVRDLAVPPASLTIRSSAGGSVTVPVDVKQGTPLTPRPIVADAGADQTVDQGATVTLDSTGSTGNILSRKWTPPAGITLSDSAGVAPTFAAKEAGTYEFTLDVTGLEGSPPVTTTKSDTVTVTVRPAELPIARIAAVSGTVPQNWPVTLDGTGTTGAATYKWEYVQAAGDPAIDLTGVGINGSKFTFTFPRTTRTLTFRLTACNGADTPQCGEPATVQVTGTTGTVTVARARFRTGRWQIGGTASPISATVPNSVTIYAGSTLGGTVIARDVPVDPATGAWQLDDRSGVPGATSVSVEGARGGQRLAVPVTR
jgi:hypothetical protein